MDKKENFAELIVLLLQSRIEDPFALLAQICRPTSIYTIERKYLRGFEREDFWQEANKVLLESIQIYKFDEGLKFVQYYGLRLENHFNRLIRAENTYKRKSTREAYSLTVIEENAGSFIDEYSSIASDPEGSLVNEEEIKNYLEDLSDFECEVFCRYLRNQPYDEIAKELNCTRNQIFSAMGRSRLKIKYLIKDLDD